MILKTGIYKLIARKALKGRWQTALVVAFLAGIIATITNVIQMLTGTDVTTAIGTIQPNTDPTELLRRMSGPYLIMLISLGLTSVLELGAKRYFIDIVRGRDAGTATVFSRLRSFPRAVLWSLRMFLTAILYMLLTGILFGIILFILMHLFGAQPIGMVNFFSALFPAVLLVVIAPVLFRYLLAQCILAEDDNSTVSQAVKTSKQWLKGRKREVLSLMLGMGLWVSVQYSCGLLLPNLLGPVISMVVSMLLSLAVFVYNSTTIAAYYVACVDERRDSMFVNVPTE